MSGLFFVAVVLLWSWLTWLVLRFGWRLANRTTELRRARMALAAVVVTAWLVASFWYSGGQNFYYDWKVRQMCAVDGGVNVYEVVKLPAAMFDRWGDPFPGWRKRALINRFGNEYVYTLNEIKLRRGDPLRVFSSAEIYRLEERITRESDKKLLGRFVVYGRVGGGIVFGHPSSFGCPVRNSSETSFARLVFVKTGE